MFLDVVFYRLEDLVEERKSRCGILWSLLEFCGICITVVAEVIVTATLLIMLFIFISLILIPIGLLLFIFLALILRVVGVI